MPFCFIDPADAIRAIADSVGREARRQLLGEAVRAWVDEIFEVIVDSAFVGVRKPEPTIYELTLERIGGGIGAAQCLFVDDVEDNVAAARELGMTAVHYRSSDQAIAEIEAALA